MLRPLSYSGWAPGVRGLGPGVRVALWVRGCIIGCPGCMTPELWEPGEPEDPQTLVDELNVALEHHDGLTISGGEPFEQAGAVADLVRELRRRHDVHVLSYSGFRKENLRSQDQRDLLSLLDILIDGPYRRDMPATLQWRGSDNQKVHLLSARARQECEPDLPAAEPRELQFQPLPDGRVRLIGIPRAGEFARISEALAQRGLATGEGG